jgi:hypothetical protein
VPHEVFRMPYDFRMQLAPITPAPVVPDPNQPPLPGMGLDVVARAAFYGDRDRTVAVKIRADRPIDAPAFASYDDALTAANQLMVRDRHDARWGLFHRNPGRADAIALLEAAEGVKLVRVDQVADAYKEPVPGQMFPGQNWWRSPASSMQRTEPSVLAVVGAEHVYDLRSGAVVEPTPLAP